MWFRKKQASAKPAPYPGMPQALDGHGVLAALASRSSDGVVVRAAPYFAELVDRLQKTADGRYDLRQTRQPGELAAMLTGMNLSGLRTDAITGRITGLSPELPAMAGNRLSCVINLTCRALARQSGTLYGGHDEYHAIAGAGLFQMFAANVQEVADFYLIAHRIAEQALTPGICAQDFYATTHAVQSLQLPEPELIAQFLGKADDIIDSPTPAQTLLFGEQRRRIPVLMDPDHPAGIGAIQDQESFFRAVAAQRPYFYSHLPALVDAALAEYAELTGRAYAPLAGYQVDDAEVVVIAQGAVIDELQAAVDTLRQQGIRAGVIKLNMLRPFPGAQLSHLLHGKKGVTVLERTDQPLAEDLPLMQEVRAVLDKGLENGRSAGKLLAYPDYQSYRQISDRPMLFSAIYGIGSNLPNAADLLAVYRNMLAGNRSNKCFYVGRLFNQPDRRFPHLQTLRQQLEKAYPDLEQLSLTGDAEDITPAATGESAAIHYLSAQGGLFAVNMLSGAIGNALQCQVRTFPRGGLEQNLQPATITVCSSDPETPISNRPGSNDIALASSWKLADDEALLATVKTGGTMVIASNRPAESLRHDLSRRIQQLISERNIQVQVVNAQKIAAETASTPAFVDQLTIWALLGVYLNIKPGLDTNKINAICNRLQEQLDELFGPGHIRGQEIMQALNRAPEERVELPQEFWQYQDKSEAPEPEPPWTVKQGAPGQHVFDTSRFWHSVGYLYDRGQAGETLTDPYLATGLIPAGSSAFRDITPFRLRLPGWLPENCTGCGVCWAACPETALPPLVQNLPALLQGAVARCEAQGPALIQMKRIADPLAKQAYKLLAKDELQQYLELGTLLQDAFDQTMEQMKLAGEKRDAMAAEFNQVHVQLAQLPLARTEPFFIEPHLQEKNSGMLLSINLNPMACTGCGVCIAACPEQAFDWTEQTAERLDSLKQNWQLQLALPELTTDRIAKLVKADQAETQVNRLLDRNAYHSMLGGDGSKPGNGAKTAIHLLTATAEAVMQQRFSRHTARLEEMIKNLQATIQGDITGTVNINNFDDFSRRLSSLEGGKLSAEKLAGLVRDDQAGLDEVKLRRQSDLFNQLQQQLHTYTQGSTGKGRARMLLAVDPGVPSWWSDTYPYNPHTQPWICYTAGHLTGLAEGLLGGTRRTLTEELKLCRTADLELSGWSSDQQEQIQTLGWSDLSLEEQQIVPPVFIVCRAGDDIRQDINRLVADNFPIKLVMINQQGLPVTDTQASDLATGNFGYYLEALALAQTDVLITQASIGHPGDLIRAITEMVEHDGPALLHIYAPEPGISGIAQERIIEQAALAVHGRAFPLFRIKREGQSVSFLLDANPEPDQDWYNREYTVREHSGQEQKLESRLTPADWAFREVRYRQHFEVMSKGHLNEGMLPLADYLELDEGQKEQYQPYIDYVNDRQQHLIATVSPAMTAACESALNHWHKLQTLAARVTTPVAELVEPTAATPEPEQPAQAAASADVYQQLTARLLELCGYSQDPEFFKQSLRQYIVPDEQQTEASD